ncbi:MAG TPA: exo-alpha-sialidase, partial [Bacteroidetes bacterium]|nr:exo-alpha-sialidase [Bacteroidota bacterium]
MKTLLSYLFLPATIFAFILLQDGFDAYEKKQVSEFTKSKYASKAQNFFGYWEWLNKIRSNPATGKIDYKAFQNAREQALTHKLSTKRSLTRAFLIDRNDYNKLFAGGVAGGLWTSDDAGYNWKQVTGFEGYATVASICQSINGDIYVGTGEGLYSNFGFAAGGLPGNGIYKSTDGGDTFSHLTSTSATLNSASDIWSHVNRLVADPNDSLKLYAATEKGIRVSTDGGGSWSLINLDVSSSSPSMDIEISSDGNTVIGAVSQYCYLSTDGGDNFTRINGDGGFPSSSIGRIELAIAPSDNNYIYAGIANGGGDLVGIYQSKDGGSNWTVIGPGSSQSFKPYSSSAQSQGTYDNSLGVALDDPEKLFVGGVGLYSWTPTDGWNKIATTSDGDPT